MEEIAEKVLKMLLREVVVVEAVELRSGAGGGSDAGTAVAGVRFENMMWNAVKRLSLSSRKG